MLDKPLAEQHELPELALIREIILQHMPEGHRLKNVDLSIGTEPWDDRPSNCSDGRSMSDPVACTSERQRLETVAPSFIVLVDIEKECFAREPFGWANKLSKIIREKWPKDAFVVKVRILMSGLGVPANA